MKRLGLRSFSFRCWPLYDIPKRSMIRTALYQRSYSTLTNTEHESLLMHSILPVVRQESKLNTESKKAFNMFWSRPQLHDEASEKSIMEYVSKDEYLRFVKLYFQSSSTIRASFYKDLMFKSRKDLKLVTELARDVLKVPDIDFKSCNDVLETVIEHALHSKYVAIAADLYQLYYRLHSNEKPNTKLSNTLISSLAFANPKYDTIYLSKFLMLDSLFQNSGMSLAMNQLQTSAICNKALNLDNSPILTKAILARVIDFPHLDSNTGLRTEHVTAAYQMIDRDFDIKNAAGIHRTWIGIKNYYKLVEFHDPKILYKILNIASKHKAHRSMGTEMISLLSPNYYCNNALLLPSIIEFATKSRNLELAQSIMININKYTTPTNFRMVVQSRKCLSVLLRMHLQFADSTGVDNVLKQISEIYGKVSEENYHSIVSHLVKTKNDKNFSKALELISKIPVKDALISYASIIDGLIEMHLASNSKSLGEKQLLLIDELLLKAHISDEKHQSSLWSTLASLYMKLMIPARMKHRKNSKINLELMKLIYINSALRSKTEDWKDITYNPFSYPSPEKIVLKIPKKNQPVILRQLALGAIFKKNKDIFQWCCSELYHLGISSDELKLDWNNMLKKSLRKSEFKSSSELEMKLSSKANNLVNGILK